MNLIKKNKLYRKMLLSTIFSTLGDSIYYLALLAYAGQFENPGLAITMVSLSETIPPLFELLTGSFADKSQNRSSKAVFCGFLRGLLYFIVGIMMGFSASITLLTGVVMINFVSDIVGRYSGGLLTPFLRFIVKEEELEEAQGLSSGIRQTIVILANFLGAFLIGIFSFKILAWINSGAFLVVMLIVFTMKSQLNKIENKELAVTEKISPKVIFSQMIASLKELYQNKKIFQTLIAFGLANGLLTVVIPLLSLLLAQNPRLVILSFAFTLALFEVITVIMMLLGNIFGSHAARKVEMMQLCQGIFLCLAFVGSGFVLNSLLLVFGGQMLGAVLAGIASPKLNATIIKEISLEKLATVSGGANLVLMILAPIATIIFPSVAAIWSLKIAGILFVAFTFVCLLFSWFQGRELVEKVTDSIKTL